MNDAFGGRLGKQDVTAAIRDVESQTAAELVVALRPASGRYHEFSFLAGALLAMVVLSLLLFLPQEFEILYFPVWVAGAFVGGAVTTELWPALHRRLLMKKRARVQVRLSSRAAFVDLDVSRTRGRTGILVYVSSFERMVEAVGDVGLDIHAAGFSDALTALERATAQGDAAAFLAALRSLGPIFSHAHPRSADDANELADEMG